MAHGLENGFFVKVPAWHGLGTVVEKAPTSEEAIKLAGLDWKAEKLPVFLGNGQLVPDTFAVVRDSDSRVLGTVGNRYEILQNSEAFRFFDPLIDSGAATYESAGSLFDGSKVWVLAKLGNPITIGNDDTIEKYVLLSSSHDGTGSVTAMVTPIRVVCNNTLSSALRGRKNAKAEGNCVSIRHTSSVADRLEQAQSLLATVNETYSNLASTWSAMASVTASDFDVKDFIKRVIPDTKATKSRAEKIRDEIEGILMVQTLGQNLDTTDGTLFGAYNAVTAYATHKRSQRKGANEETHFDSVFFGTGANLIDRAQQVAEEIMIEIGAAPSLSF